MFKTILLASMALGLSSTWLVVSRNEAPAPKAATEAAVCCVNGCENCAKCAGGNCADCCGTACCEGKESKAVAKEACCTNGCENCANCANGNCADCYGDNCAGCCDEKTAVKSCCVEKREAGK